MLCASGHSNDDVSRDPALRRWTSSLVDNDADGARWVQAQQQGWAAGTGSASPSLRHNPPRALDTLTSWAFDTFEADGLERLELPHQVDNPASCRVAQKSRC